MRIQSKNGQLREGKGCTLKEKDERKEKVAHLVGLVQDQEILKVLERGEVVRTLASLP